MSTIDIYRGSNIVASIEPNKNSSQQKKVMGDNLVSLSFELNRMVNFALGDYATIFGEQYFISKLPIATKKSLYNYEYDLQLQSSQQNLAKAQYMFYDNSNNLAQGEFSLYATADEFIDLLVLNANRVSAGWKKGGVISNGYKNLTFAKEDCLSVLQKLATTFETEFYIQGTTIHLAKQSNVTGFKLRYGRNRGLYDITRTQTDQPVITRLYALGGMNNLPATYAGNRLRLPGGFLPCLVTNVTYTVTQQGNATQDIVFTWNAPTEPAVTAVTILYRLVGSTAWIATTAGHLSPRMLTGIPSGIYEVKFRTEGAICATAETAVIIVDQTITLPVLTSNPIPYLEKNIPDYGLIESTYINDDIFPRRTGKVTAVDATNVYKFKDVTIDFNVNTQLLPGLPAKITFNTGQLKGYTFEISAFNDTTKEFTVLKNKDEKALDLPSINIPISINDEYVLTDILMPQSYVADAESELKVKAQEYLDKYSVPNFNYNITCDPAYFRRNKYKMNLGDVVWIEDIEFQVSRYIRVIGLTKSLSDEFEYSLELGEEVSQGVISQLAASQSSTNQGVQSLAQTINNNALLSGTYIGDFKIEQGTGVIKDMLTASTTAGMKQVYIDSAGRLWRAP